MNTAFIKTISSKKGAIGVVGVIVFLFVIAAVGAAVFYVSSGTGNTSHAQLIPQDSFLVYSAVSTPEFNEKWSKAIGKTKEEMQDDAMKQLQGAAELFDIKKLEKILTSLSDAEDAFGRVTFAMSNLDLDIKKRKVEMPDWGYGNYNDPEDKAVEEEDYVEPPSVPPPPQAEPAEDDDDEGYDPTEKPGEEKSKEDKPAIPDDIEGPFPEPQDDPEEFDDDWTEKDRSFEKQYYTKSDVKMHLDMQIIIEVKDEAKFKEVGKNLEFDMDTAEFKEHQGVKYFEIKMLDFSDLFEKVPDFELGDGHVFACVFGRNLVVANGEANIKNIIDVQKGTAKSLKDNPIAEKRMDWSDDVFCSWFNVNYLMNFFAERAEKDSDYKDFQQVYNAMKLSDIESFVIKSKADLSDSFVSKIYINSTNKYLALLNQLPTIKSEDLFADLPKNSHVSFAASMDKVVEVIDIFMEELRKDLPKEMTEGMPETLEREGFPENTFHLLQYIGGFVNISKDLISSNFVSTYKLAENASKDEFSKYLKTEYVDLSETGFFEGNTFYSGMDPSKLETMRAQLKTAKLNSVIKKLDKDMHALCIITSPENLFKMLAEEQETIDFDALKSRKDFYVCGMTIEKDGISFTFDPMFDFAVAVSKYMPTIQENMLKKQQEQMAGFQWFEAGSTCSSIKQSVDIYKAKHGDLSGLKDLLKDGFVKDSKLLEELDMFEGMFDHLQNFDIESFSLEFLTDGKDGHYVIKVDVSKGNGGESGMGPKEGVGSYDSKTDKWTGKLEQYGQMFSQMPNFEEPPEKPFKPFDDDEDDEDPWAEAKTAVGSLKAALDTYHAKMGGDISGLKDLLADGCGSGSKLLKELRFDDSAFKYLFYFDAEDFSVEFVTDGKDGKYIIKVDASKGVGGMSEAGPKEGTGSYNSKTGEWSGMLK